MERRTSAGAWVALGAGLSALTATALVAAATGMHEGWKNVAVAALPLLPVAACVLAARQGRETRRLRALAVALSLILCPSVCWARRPDCGQSGLRRRGIGLHLPGCCCHTGPATDRPPSFCGGPPWRGCRSRFQSTSFGR